MAAGPSRKDNSRVPTVVKVGCIEKRGAVQRDGHEAMVRALGRRGQDDGAPSESVEELDVSLGTAPRLAR